jgi:hypothetical protein
MVADIAWLVKSGLSHGDNVRLREACDACGTPYIEVGNIDIALGLGMYDRTFLYGPFDFTLPALATGKFNPGVVWSDNFNVTQWHKYWGELCLNTPKVLKFQDILEHLRSLPVDHKMFLRPCNEGKNFKGMARKVKELIDWTIAANLVFPDLHKINVAISEYRELSKEYRAFVVDSYVVTGSLYQSNGKPDQGPLPEPVLSFCKKVIDRWRPAPLFTLDVCETSSGYKIVEAGCFNSSGLYTADTRAIVSAVKDYYRGR